MSPTTETSMLQRDISAIQDKRQVLEQIINIAQTIESMQTSLESVLILGVPSRDLPEEALNLYSSISDNLRNLPVNKIKDYLRNLEAIIRKQLEKILHYSNSDLSSDDSVELLFISSDGSDQSPLQMLEDFKRTAQTAVSLRVLLRRRGVATEGSPLPVARKEIEHQITRLEWEEQKQRGKIRLKISEMKVDIERMIDNPAYPDGLKEILRGVNRNLENDLKNIDLGVKLSSLSFVTDADEITGIQDISTDTAEPEESGPAEQASLAESARLWLNTPWNVTWEEVRHKH